MPKDKPWLVKVEHDLAGGFSFAEAVQDIVNADLHVQLLLAEQHGQLGVTLNELGSFLQAQQRQRRKLFALLQYPVLLLLLLGTMAVALGIFVYPELRTWQGNSQPSIWHLFPWKSVIAFFLAFLAVLGLAYHRNWRKKDVEGRVRERCHWPIIGKMYRQYYGYYLISTAAMLLSHGLSLKECCQVAASFDNDSLLSWWGCHLSKNSHQDSDLIEAVEGCPYLPAELSIFLQQGLSQERLANELTVFGQLLFRRLLTTIERLLVFVQPVMFLLVAMMIVGMYLSILLPIYHSLQGVY